MKLRIQWTRADPLGWEELDIQSDADWRNLPFREDPTSLRPQPTPDDKPGWVFALGCQGITFSGDHYVVERAGLGYRIHVINDDPEDFPGDLPHVYVWTLRPLRFDWNVQAMNTNQSLEIYVDPRARRKLWAGDLMLTGGQAVFRDIKEYVSPPSNMIRHGLQVADQLARTHNMRRERIPWTERERIERESEEREPEPREPEERERGRP